MLIDESEVRDEDIQEAPELADRVGEKHMIAQKGMNNGEIIVTMR